MPLLFAVFVFFACSRCIGAPVVIVAPNSLLDTEGNSNNVEPFNSPIARRYQQVFDSSQFDAISGQIRILQIAFRADTRFDTSFTATNNSVEIALSTTTRGPDNLSSVFADNIGFNETMVFSGPLTISHIESGAPQEPQDFNIVIGLHAPFDYDPALGHLLMDFTMSGLGTQINGFGYDAENTIGDATSRVRSATDVNSPNGLVDSIGLVTQFTAVAVPEPSGMSIALIGIVLFSLRRSWWPT